MSAVRHREFRSRHRVIAFFRDALGYDYRSDWKERPDNSNFEFDIRQGWLRHRGHGDGIVGKALDRLGKASDPVGFASEPQAPPGA